MLCLSPANSTAQREMDLTVADYGNVFDSSQGKGLRLSRRRHRPYVSRPALLRREEIISLSVFRSRAPSAGMSRRAASSDVSAGCQIHTDEPDLGVYRLSVRFITKP